MSSTHVMLNHTAFPLLIDLIFDYAPRASLLVMRSVSREWRRRSDEMLAWHLIVLPQLFYQAAPIMTSPHGRLPSLHRYHSELHAQLHRLQVRNTDPDWNWHRDIRQAVPIVKAARILEIMPTMSCELLVRLTISNTLRVIKIAAPKSAWVYKLDPILVPTVITFSHFNHPGRYDYETGDGECTTFSIIRQYYAGKRFVLSICVPCRLLTPHELEGIEAFPHNPATLEHVVLIFSKHAPITLEESHQPPATLKPLHIIANAFRTAVSKTVKFTLVGVETVNRSWLGFSDDLADDDLVSAVAAAVRGLVVEARATRKLDWSDHDIDEIANAVEILTHDEYKARVGDEQYVFETVEDGEA